MPAQGAKALQHIGHIVILPRKGSTTGAEAKNTIDAAGNGTWVITLGGQPQAAVFDDTAAAAEIGEAVAVPVDRCRVERSEKALSIILEGIFDDNPRRQRGQCPSYLPTAAVRANDDPQPRIVIGPIGLQQAEYRIEFRVQGGFPAEQPDPAPANAGGHAVDQKSFHLRHRHVNRGRRLGAGTIAIEAAQIAAIGDVDLNPLAAALKGAPEVLNHWPLAADGLPQIKQQPFERYVAVNRRRVGKPAPASRAFWRRSR